MNEYKVEWTPYPTAYNQTRVLFVEAANIEDAKELARNHVERHYGIPRTDFMIGRSAHERHYGSKGDHYGVELVGPLPQGSVKESSSLLTRNRLEPSRRGP